MASNASLGAASIPVYTELRTSQRPAVKLKKAKLLCIAVSVLCLKSAFAGGPFGIDHRVAVDDDGIFQRQYQFALLYSLIGVEVAGALWQGGESRSGKTSWQSIDSSVIAIAAAEVLKAAFSRERPTKTDDPNRFFKGNSNRSFLSGEVSAVSAVVTPFVLEYRHDYPLVYALELLPLYDAIARVKVRGHWQSDVIAGFAIGSLAGYYAHSREQPFILSVLPGGFMVGLHKSF